MVGKLKRLDIKHKQHHQKGLMRYFLDKIKGLINKQKDRSQRFDLRAKIISQPKYLTEFQRKEEEFETKNKKAKTTAKKANQKPKQKKTINADSDGPAEAIECVCLKEKVTVFEEEANPQSEIIVISDVMIGPLKCGMAGRGKWNVPNYWKIKKYVETVSKFDRVSCKNRCICDKYKDC